jgi:predicted extracellular nuclease
MYSNIAKSTQNGGEPGGNIRPAFIYKPEVLELVNFRQGTANDSAVVTGTSSNATIKYVLDSSQSDCTNSYSHSFNPALVSPENPAFVRSRKPLVAHFRVRATNATLWSINVHQASKGGSSPLEGDWRTPSNGAIEARVDQAKITSVSSCQSLYYHWLILLVGIHQNHSRRRPSCQHHDCGRL